MDVPPSGLTQFIVRYNCPFGALYRQSISPDRIENSRHIGPTKPSNFAANMLVAYTLPGGGKIIDQGIAPREGEVVDQKPGGPDKFIGDDLD